MSTNFYWHPEPCPTCLRGVAVLHIGKATFGSFSFEGHFEPRLVCAQDWFAALRSRGVVRDEYDRIIEADQLILDIMAVPEQGRRRQYDWCVRHVGHLGVRALDVVQPFADWLDADGFSFHGGEFS